MILTVLSLTVFDLGVFGVLLSQLITSVVFFVYVIITFLRKQSLKLEHPILKECFKYSLPLLPHNLANWSNGTLDKLLVNGKEMPYSNCIRYGRVPSGLISYNSIDLEKSALKDLGVEEIETIEMTFKVISDDYILIAGDLNVTVNYK